MGVPSVMGWHFPPTQSPPRQSWPQYPQFSLSVWRLAAQLVSNGASGAASPASEVPPAAPPVPPDGTPADPPPPVGVPPVPPLPPVVEPALPPMDASVSVISLASS